jgi:hypothetical protein
LSKAYPTSPFNPSPVTTSERDPKHTGTLDIAKDACVTTR